LRIGHAPGGVRCAPGLFLRQPLSLLALARLGGRRTLALSFCLRDHLRCTLPCRLLRRALLGLALRRQLGHTLPFPLRGELGLAAPLLLFRRTPCRQICQPTLLGLLCQPLFRLLPRRFFLAAPFIGLLARRQLPGLLRRTLFGQALPNLLRRTLFGQALPGLLRHTLFSQTLRVELSCTPARLLGRTLIGQPLRRQLVRTAPIILRLPLGPGSIFRRKALQLERSLLLSTPGCLVSLPLCQILRIARTALLVTLKRRRLFLGHALALGLHPLPFHASLFLSHQPLPLLRLGGTLPI
jgi:hypothetical protein